jgi:pyruvate dehydrogenase E1 component alpha subunit
MKKEYNFYQSNSNEVVEELGPDRLIDILDQMLLIRNFEMRAEAAYQQGKIGGFFHAYTGQEAIQTGAVNALGIDPNWWVATYRCHALALLTGATPNELMAELYGKENGNAGGRGGSMHLYSDRLLGGFGIVGGHMPIIAGAAFSLKYQKQDGLAVGFLGDGACVQGAFHESMNLLSLWGLPGIVVIENNQWGMGTATDRAVCVQPIAENFAKAYGIESYTIDGTDVLHCYQAFQEIGAKVKKEGKPILVEAMTERFKGHSISDPALYRSKDDLKCAMEKGPLINLRKVLEENGMLKEGQYDERNDAMKQIVIDSMKYAEESPLPSIDTLEEGVFAP